VKICEVVQSFFTSHIVKVKRIYVEARGYVVLSFTSHIVKVKLLFVENPALFNYSLHPT